MANIIHGGGRSKSGSDYLNLLSGSALPATLIPGAVFAVTDMPASNWYFMEMGRPDMPETGDIYFVTNTKGTFNTRFDNVHWNFDVSVGWMVQWLNGEWVELEGYYGNADGWEQISYERGTPVLDTYTWAEIKAIADAGNYKEIFSLGDVKTVTLKTGEVIRAEIIAFDLDKSSQYAGTGIPMSFWMQDCLNTKYPLGMSDNDEAQGFLGTDLYDVLFDQIEPSLPQDLYDVCALTYKPRTRPHSDSDSNWMYEYKRRLWVMNEMEMLGYHSLSNQAQGTPYPFIVSNPAKRIKKCQGEFTTYWTDGTSRDYTGTSSSRLRGGIFVEENGLKLTITHNVRGEEQDVRGVCVGFCI